METQTDRKTAAARYEALKVDRQHYLTSARENAALTIPTLFPEDTDARNARQPQKINTPFQSLGARAVNNLSAKLLLALFPPETPFFRYKTLLPAPDDDETKQLKSEIDAALADRERKVVSQLETGSYRSTSNETLQHLIVTGNGLVHWPDRGGMRFFPLDRYVCRRGPMGEVLEIVVKEGFDADAVPQRVRDLAPDEWRRSLNSKSTIDVYTWVKYDADRKRYTSIQEAFGFEVPGTGGSWPEDKVAWRALRWTSVAGEDYGRGFVEQYRGDLNALEALSRALVAAAAAAAKVLFFLKGTLTNRSREIQNKPNGAFVAGNVDDVGVLQVNKFADMRVAREQIESIKSDLSFAFLLKNALRRDAERVTAEEIRTLVEELEDTLGGVYSLLAEEFQLPMVRRLEAQLLVAKKIRDFGPGSEHIEPVIVTGVEAIGRTNDLHKIRAALADTAALIEIDPGVVDHLKTEDILSDIWVAHGHEKDRALRTVDQVAQLRQQRAQAQAMQQARDAAFSSGGQVAGQIGGEAVAQGLTEAA